MPKKVKTDVALTVQCLSCKATKVLLASEGPHKDIPLCPNDGMPMVPKMAEVKKGRRVIARGKDSLEL